MSDEMNFLAASKPTGGEKEKIKQQKRFGGRRGVTVNLATREIMRETAKRIGRKSVRTISISIVVSLALSALSYGVVLIYGQMQKRTFETVTSPLGEINKEIEALEGKSKELITFQSKLVAVKSLFDGHTYMADVFSKLEKTTLPEVSYTDVSVTPNMTMNISGIANSYTTLGRQLLAFKRAGDFVSKADISSAAAVLGSDGQISGVNFTMSLTIQNNDEKREAE